MCVAVVDFEERARVPDKDAENVRLTEGRREEVPIGVDGIWTLECVFWGGCGMRIKEKCRQPWNNWGCGESRAIFGWGSDVLVRELSL